MKQSTELKMNLGGDEMGKQDDVMKNGKRGGKGILQAFHFELRGIRWPVSRIVGQLVGSLRNFTCCQRIGIYLM